MAGLSQGTVRSLPAGVALLAAVGVRYPLQMLPLLLFELVGKAIWLLVFALPLWTAHPVDAEAAESIKACLMGIVLCPLVIPWPYVWAHYVTKRGDRWAISAGTKHGQQLHR